MSAYEVTDVGTLEGFQSSAYAVNAQALVVGDSDPTPVPSKARAFAWGQGAITDLAPLSAATSVATGVTAAGLIVGSADLPDARHAFLHQGGQTTDLNPVLGASYARASDVDEAGRVVGGADFSAAANQWGLHAFLYDTAGAQTTDLGTLPGTNHSVAAAINDLGHVVGGSGGNVGASRPFFWADGTMTPVVDEVGMAWDINNADQVVGATVSGGAFASQGGQTIQLPVNGLPYGNNDAGQIVGWGIGHEPNVVEDDQFAFLIENGALVDLNAVLVNGAGWHLTAAYDITNEGYIVGIGDHQGEPRGYLLSPTQAPLQIPTPVIDATLVATILFGVTKDGGGRVLVAGKPSPIDPWGPLKAIGAGVSDDLARGVLLLSLAARIADESARAAVQAVAQDLISRVVESRRPRG